MHTPIRRCLQALTQQSQPTLSLFKDQSSLRSLSSAAAFLNQNISSPLLPIFTNSKAISAFGQWHHGRYFSSSKQDDHIKEGGTHEIEDEDDVSDDDDDDDYDEEEGDYEDDDDDTVAVSSRKKVYTAEEKEAEAEAIGYKVVGPLQKNDNVFKPYEPAFAVVQIGSHQFKVSNGDSIFTERLKFCEVNDKLILNKVLLLGSPSQTIVGRPIVPNGAVHAVVEEHSLFHFLATIENDWHTQFPNTEKGKKQNDPASVKAVLLSGTPGIGKTMSANLVCQELRFQAIEVNASDSLGKADSKIEGVGGNIANSIKELVTNELLGRNMDRSKQSKTVLIMDEVDGMSADGVADLIASIKISKIPIICICNDHYCQKLKSLKNYCLLLCYSKPTKQQMVKKFMDVAEAEWLQVDEIALEELAERVDGDMRMALNQLQYMSLSMPVINSGDIRQQLLTIAKDEDISPFIAVDKLFGLKAGEMKMDERINLSMSDPELVLLLTQENYINYRPSSVGKDDNGVKRMNLIARAAESIATGDIVNVQIHRYRQWQLSQTSFVASCILPACIHCYMGVGKYLNRENGIATDLVVGRGRTRQWAKT